VIFFSRNRFTRDYRIFVAGEGMLVLGRNQATPMLFGDNLDFNPLAVQPQAGL